MLLQGLPGLLCLDVLPHAAGVGVASVLRLERSGLRTPCQNTSSAYGFTVKGFLLLPPLRPLVLASPPVAWSGLWGRPLLFSCSFPRFFLPPLS